MDEMYVNEVVSCCSDFLANSSWNDHQQYVGHSQSQLRSRIPRKYIRSKVLSEEELDRRRMTANVQERQRMQRLNSALQSLKAVLPNEFKAKRLSKIKTLQLAIGYIQFLDDTLKSSFDKQQCEMTAAN
ncbi:hypothetical protein CHUAL_002213 [Chamberlinius hualienensis]